MLIAQHVKFFFRWLLPVWFIVVSSATVAQNVTVVAELDTSRALIGDQLRLFLSVEKPPDLRLDFPVLKDTIARKIEVISDSYTDTSLSSTGRLTYGRTILITVFDTGFFEIPAMSFIAHTGLSKDTFRTSPLGFQILSVRTDSALHDIKGNLKAPINMTEVLYYAGKNYPYILLALALGLLVWYIVRVLKKKKHRDAEAEGDLPAESPDIVALRELEKLRDEKPWLHGKVKYYHIQLSETLRKYIEGRFKIMALEQTTDEILDALKSPLCKTSDRHQLAGILKLADLVKFAKVIPEENENAAQVDMASEFIRNTMVHPDGALPEGDNKTLVQDNIPTGNA